MGWTYEHRDKGTTDKAYFGAKFGEGYDLLDAASCGGTVYGALKVPGGDVVGLVILTRYARDYFNFGYKDMDETMGPNEAHAPARILDLLTPTDNEYALAWRAACRANLARRDAAKAVKPGALIKFATALRFTNGVEADTFEFVKGATFRVGGTLYGLGRDWRASEFTVLTNGGAK